MLTELDHLPPGLLDTAAEDLHQILPGPTLIHLGGRREPPLFVSVLLHGNEDTGLIAVQRLLNRLRGHELPRALSLFIGNVAAARYRVRRLEGQPDYNRTWPGTESPESEETRLMRQVFELMAQRRPFASIDLHNNTGFNPHYSAVNRTADQFLQLASLFGRTVVYFRRPKGVQTAAFAELCPSVTVECGKPGQDHGVEHALEYLEACLNLASIPDHPVAAHDIDLFHTVAQVHIRDEISFGIGETAADLALDRDLDRLNFRELPAGTELGVVREGGGMPVVAYDEPGQEVTRSYFAVDHRRLVLTRPMMPSMLTLDERVLRQDCLCYLMERLPPPQRQGDGSSSNTSLV